MVPNVFISTEWLVAVHSVPRGIAIPLLVLFISMLAFGLRGYRYYLVAGAGVAAWTVGHMLGRLMHVTSWYVALPAAAMTAPLMWPQSVSKRVMPALIGLTMGCAVGTFLAYGAQVANFWLGFVIGIVGGTSVSLLAQRFMNALFFATVGAVGFVAVLGAVVRSETGLFAPGAYADQPAVFMIVGAVLIVGSMIAQVSLDPDPL